MRLFYHCFHCTASLLLSRSLTAPLLRPILPLLMINATKYLGIRVPVGRAFAFRLGGCHCHSSQATTKLLQNCRRQSSLIPPICPLPPPLPADWVTAQKTWHPPPMPIPCLCGAPLPSPSPCPPVTHITALGPPSPIHLIIDPLPSLPSPILSCLTW